MAHTGGSENGSSFLILTEISTQRMKKNIKILILLLLCSLTIWVLVTIIRTLVLYNQTVGIRISFDSGIPNEYLNLFNKSDAKLITNPFTDSSLIRHQLSHFDFNDKFYIVVTKVDCKSDSSLFKIITLIKSISTLTLNKGYFDAGNNSFSLSYLPKKVKFASANLRIDGDSIQIVRKNNTTVCYSFLMRGFSLEYDNSRVEDLVCKAKTDEIPVSLCFIKRSRTIYIILMSIKEKGVKIKPDALIELLR